MEHPMQSLFTKALSKAVSNHIRLSETIIQPLGPGSPGDIVSRVIGESLAKTLGQPVVVQNRVGANGIIGMEACAKAAGWIYDLCSEF
jgi:tripartite-type tricarboxylate transporter receptor subunit TctC